MRYGGGAKTVDMTFSSPDIPFPELKLSYAEAAFNLLLPLAKTEEPADFAFLTKLVDLKVSDEIWGMFDPGAVLPRDPATIVIDTKGKAKVTADISDPAAMSEGTPPGELHALDVTELRASVAGAELTGSGAFTFDNTDTVTFGGMPAPTGKLDLRLVGGNGLMQKLVTLGILSEEDVMGANMMLSMFANPGPGEDELSSTLEFKDKGFFANGRANILKLRRLLLALRGKQKAFYLPTFIDDLTPAANLISGSSALDISHIGFTRFVVGGVSPRDTIRVTFTDGSTLTRSIVSSQELSSTTERLTLSTTWPANRPVSEISKIEYLELSRFDTDTFLFRYSKPSTAVVIAPVVTVFD